MRDREQAKSLIGQAQAAVCGLMGAALRTAGEAFGGSGAVSA